MTMFLNVHRCVFVYRHGVLPVLFSGEELEDSDIDEAIRAEMLPEELGSVAEEDEVEFSDEDLEKVFPVPVLLSSFCSRG